MYDTKCHEIAEFFMSDEPEALQTAANIARIAQRVQDVIEDEIDCIKEDADATAELEPYIGGGMSTKTCPRCGDYLAIHDDERNRKCLEAS